MTDRDVMNYSKQLSDFNTSVRRFAIRKLLEYKSPISVPYLIQALEDTDTLVRTNAENALIAIGEQKVEDVLYALNNNDSEVRLRLLNVYKSYNTAIHLDKIVPLLEDDDDDVKNFARSILEKRLDKLSSLRLWNKLKQRDLDNNTREIIEALLNKNITGISKEIILDLKENIDDMRLRSIGSKLYIKLEADGDDYFLDFQNSAIMEERIAFLSSLRSLPQEIIIKHAIQATEDENIEVRKKGVELLGLYGTVEEIPFLLELKNTPSKKVWKVSKIAIEKINDRSTNN